jgi:hypothetical protein
MSIYQNIYLRGDIIFMKSKKLKQILAIAIASTMVSTIAPVTASAAWLKDSQNNWSFIEGGNKVTGWKQVDGTWYHFDANGKMQTGWVQTADSKWYYMSANGGMKTGWLQDTNGKWYYLASSGEMKTGWILDTDGKWYFADVSGAMQTGIIQVQGKTYVLEASGAMATGSVVIGEETYTLDASGAITGDKLPTPGKVFTNEGKAQESNVTEDTKPETTSSTDNSSSSSSSSSSSRHHHSSSSSSSITSGQDLSCDAAGTYGPDSGTVEVNNVSVNAPGVTLKNMHIKGDLVLGEGVGEGDVYLNNVTVDGTTIVKGGGQNSIHFVNSVLATVIVNKNDGKIRLVVEGNSQVAEVQLESPAKLEESNLSGGATGFNNIDVTDNVQTGSNLQVELVGSFETINSRATNVRIQLDQSTDVQNLVLNVLAQVLGTGTINTATINSGADGSTLSSRPENMVLRANSVSLRDESAGTQTTITDSYSNAASTAITGVKLGVDSIKVNMSNFVAGLTTGDFNVTAKLDGQDYTLQNLNYDANDQRLTFDPVALEGNVGKVLQVTITPASDKVTGSAQSDQVTVKNGFSGRITDVQGVGISGVTIKFRQGADSRDGDVVGTVVTDDEGYYTAYLAPGQYTGEMSGTGILKTYMYASSLSDRFNVKQNETAIRATGMDSVKIVLTWGVSPSDEDSHLEGPTADGGRFHTWYADKIYQGGDGIRYADLDWDDTDSYGPETTTIYKLEDGNYRFYVHNYSGEAPLVGSGAKVEVYKGSSETANNTFTIPNDTSKTDAGYWFVFDMSVSNNGETINVSPVNELRKSMILKVADAAEASYCIYDGDSFTDEDGTVQIENGLIEGVPAGTVADIKADLSAYDGGTLKVFAQGTDVSNATKFDAATELLDSSALDNGQIVAVKEQDGTIKAYTISVIGENPVLDSDYLTQNDTTTPSAVTLTWDKATDNKTPQNKLKYSLYMSENNNYNTIEDWESNAKQLTEATDIDSFEVTGLDDTLDYYFKLIVEDADGNKTAYETEHRPPTSLDKATLIREIESAKQDANYALIGTNAGNFSQADLDAFKEAISAAETIANSASATQDDINNAYEALQQAEEAFYDTAITELRSDISSVFENTNFDEIIPVEINGTGDFAQNLNADNIRLGGDFTGLTIKSITVDPDNTYKADIELSGNLQKSAGVGTITINEAGWNGPTAGRDITCSLGVTTSAAVEVDKTALIDEITTATTNSTSAAVSADGSDVVTTDKWVLQADVTAYTDAIAAAQAVADKADATQNEVEDAVVALGTATDAFNNAKEAGTKVATGVDEEFYYDAKLDSTHKIITFTFNKNIINNTADMTELKNAITISTGANEENYNPLGENDTVEISGDVLKITFDQALPVGDNWIFVDIKKDALKDEADNVWGTGDIWNQVDERTSNLNPNSDVYHGLVITVNGTEATHDYDSRVYNVQFTDGTDLTKLAASDITVTSGYTDIPVTIGTPATSDGGKTWTVGVTVEGGPTITYTINATAAVAVDKTALTEAIVAANQEAASTVVGTEVGNYAQADLDTFKEAISAAQSVVDKTEATQNEVQDAISALDTAKTTFESTVVKA